MLPETPVNAELKYLLMFVTCAGESVQGRNGGPLLSTSFAGGSAECTEV